MRRLGIFLGCAGIALAVLAPGAGAATITVDEFDDPIPAIDIGCSIRDAIESANDNADFPECESTGSYGTAPDTILIPGGMTSTLDRPDELALDDENANVTGDLDIEGPVTITATGNGLATIDAQDTLTAGGTEFRPLDRVLHVEPSAGGVTLNRLRITGGVRVDNRITPHHGGGGILTESALTITDSEIVENISQEGNVNSTALGGGIHVSGANARLTMTGSTVAENLVQTDIDFNSGSAAGGGIAAFPASLGVDITNSTISGNRAVGVRGDAGSHVGVIGGLSAANGPSPGFSATPVSLTNVTITDNEANAQATQLANGAVGGIQISAGSTITGSLIAGNTDTRPDNFDAPTGPDGDFPDCGITPTSGGGNLIGQPGATACETIAGPNDRVGGTTQGTSINPNVGTLINNGGLTRTHALNQGSEAINRGGTCPATDQRGLFRYISLPCDAGSLEIGATATPPPPAQTVTPAVQQPTPPATAPKCPKGKKQKRVKGKVKCVKKKRKKK